MKRIPLDGILHDCLVRREYHPSTFRRQHTDPLDIGGGGIEAIDFRNRFMSEGMDDRLYRPRHMGCNVMVEERLHAASLSSNF